jgi:hypothetical protein
VAQPESGCEQGGGEGGFFQGQHRLLQSSPTLSNPHCGHANGAKDVSAAAPSGPHRDPSGVRRRGREDAAEAVRHVRRGRPAQAVGAHPGRRGRWWPRRSGAPPAGRGSIPRQHGARTMAFSGDRNLPSRRPTACRSGAWVTAPPPVRNAPCSQGPSQKPPVQRLGKEELALRPSAARQTRRGWRQSCWRRRQGPCPSALGGDGEQATPDP